jgi:hypothetical protein
MTQERARELRRLDSSLTWQQALKLAATKRDRENDDGDAPVKKQHLEDHDSLVLATVTYPRHTLLYRGAKEKEHLSLRKNDPGWFARDHQTATLYGAHVATFQTDEPFTLVVINRQNVETLMRLAHEQFGDSRVGLVSMVEQIDSLILYSQRHNMASKAILSRLQSYRQDFANVANNSVQLGKLLLEYRDYVSQTRKFPRAENEIYNIEYRLRNETRISQIPSFLRDVFPIRDGMLHRNSKLRQDQVIANWLCSDLHIQGFLADDIFDEASNQLEQHAEILLCPAMLKHLIQQ